MEDHRRQPAQPADTRYLRDQRRKWAGSSKGYWRVAGSKVLQVSLPNSYWNRLSLKTLSKTWQRLIRGRVIQGFLRQSCRRGSRVGGVGGLTDAGYSVELDVWDWAAGRNFVTTMSGALGRADRVVALFSAAYFEPERYTTEEWSATLVHVPGVVAGRLVPVRVEAVSPRASPSQAAAPLTSSDSASVSENGTTLSRGSASATADCTAAGSF